MAILLLTSRPEFGTVRSRDAQPLDATLRRAAQPRERLGAAFGLWSSSPITAEFPTVYAAHFLVEAKDRGQKIPTE